MSGEGFIRKTYYIYSTAIVLLVLVTTLLLGATGGRSTALEPTISATPEQTLSTPLPTPVITPSPEPTLNITPTPTATPTPTPYATPPLSGDAKHLIVVNAAANGQVVRVYSKDSSGKYTVLEKEMICSTGMNNSTPLGRFKIYVRYRWILLQGDVYGQYALRFYGSILFHSVPYIENRKPDTLQWEEWNKLGQQASAGCVRMSVEDVKWLYDHCDDGTIVVVYEGPDEAETRARLKLPDITESENGNWDPTDPEAPRDPS